MIQKYLITSEELYTQDPLLFVGKLSQRIQLHKPQYVLFRDKTNKNYALLAKEFIQVCKKENNIKSFLHQDVRLAKELGAKGVHLTSLQFNEIIKAKSLGLEVIISTHTKEEVLQAEALGADGVTYSPIFHSPNKGTPKGIEDLKQVVSQTGINVFALGGIVDEKEVALIQATNAYGFASIRYFT